MVGLSNVFAPPARVVEVVRLLDDRGECRGRRLTGCSRQGDGQLDLLTLRQGKLAKRDDVAGSRGLGGGWEGEACRVRHQRRSSVQRHGRRERDVRRAEADGPRGVLERHREGVRGSDTERLIRGAAGLGSGRCSRVLGRAACSSCPRRRSRSGPLWLPQVQRRPRSTPSSGVDCSDTPVQSASSCPEPLSNVDLAVPADFMPPSSAAGSWCGSLSRAHALPRVPVRSRRRAAPPRRPSGS